MTHRKPRAQDFVGKTVKSVDFRAGNLLRFYFTNGTAIALEHERDVIVACNECVQSDSEQQQWQDVWEVSKS